MTLGNFFERIYPFALAAAAGGLLYRFFDPGAIEAKKLEALGAAAISIAAILMGFLGTAKAMLLSFRSPRFDWLKKNKALWGRTMGYMKQALYSSFLVCLLSLGMLTFGTPAEWIKCIAVGWLAAVVFSVATFFRVAQILFVLLEAE